MKKYFILVIGLLFINSSFSQESQEWNSDKIYRGLKKLNFLGSVLYVGAHPDDENTQVISYFSNHKHAETSYLALTRGDGGQNLIGSEIRESLGVIRTQELLAARNIDGGQQFFTRANDFGYSKTPQESFSIWDKEQVFSDVVRVFRKFRPDVVIDRFNHRTEGDTHGHHTASARLSVKAFDEATKKNRFAGQVEKLGTWQPEKLYFNTSYWFYESKEAFEKADKSNYAQVNVGEFLPIQGLSNSEIAAQSRSQHKSQGFGNTASRKNEMEFLEPIKGDFHDTPKSVFAGVDTTWARVNGGAKIGEKLEHVIADYDFTRPSKSLSGLVDVYQMIKDLDAGYWRRKKLKEVKELIAAASGLYLQASTTSQFGIPGENFDLHLEATNRSDFPVQIQGMTYSNFESKAVNAKTLKANTPFYRKYEASLPEDTPFSTPYWLKQKAGVGMYKVDKKKFIGLPETPNPIKVKFNLNYDGVPISFERQIVYKANDRVKGEVLKPFNIIPKVAVNLKNENLVFPDNTAKKIKAEVTAYSPFVSGEIKLNHPEGWEVTPQAIDLTFDKKGTKTVTFTVNPPEKPEQGELKPVFKTDDKSYSKKLNIINYDHIPQQAVLLPSAAQLIRLQIERKGDRIGYIKGAGDAVAENLEILGYDVDVFTASAITPEKLKQYDAIVIGIRAYNVSQKLADNNQVVLNYVKRGGTLITQYNTTAGLNIKNPSPFDLHISHDRVTDEDSPVQFLDKKSPVLNTPNTISKKDFEGWVQERGLYFPDRWGEEFKPVLSFKDPNEAPKKSSLLIAKYGKGHYIYTGLSFFREFPAGVPGAFRLFANLIAIGN